MVHQLISAIIPARDEEASIARAVESVAEQPEIGEVIVVDDHSTDRTPHILDELARRLGKVRVMRAGELPTGWSGKNNAVWTGAQIASGEWLLFTDADTCHLTGAAARALEDAARSGADLVSYSPEQEAQTFWERALVPLVYWRLSQRYVFERVNDSGCSDAAANGQFVLVRREAYEALGGHAAIAGEILEDVALARRIKQGGFRIFFGCGAGIVQARMYRSFGAMWEGWTKNLYPLFGGSAGEMLMEMDAATPALGLIFAVLLVGEIATGGHVDWLLALVAVILFVRPWVWYEAWLRRSRYPAGYIRYYLAGSGLYAAALAASWWKNTHGAVAWKGRKYTGVRRGQFLGTS
ncbi:MAG TPA: glycosyltransferase family 2 protein [Candidatus Acidoferrales bacterium]|nr:glycosyltransferase family 2 protein [Candidatus Acidoferrales bacterium]